MGRYLLILAVSAFTLSSNSFADHNGGNYAEAANLAYQLADIGEFYSGTYDYQLSSAANSMHHAASTLYYALRNRAGGGYRYDHQGGSIGAIHQMVFQVGNRVDYFAQMAPYGVGSQARSLYQMIRNHLGC